MTEIPFRIPLLLDREDEEDILDLLNRAWTLAKERGQCVWVGNGDMAVGIHPENTPEALQQIILGLSD